MNQNNLFTYSSVFNNISVKNLENFNKILHQKHNDDEDNDIVFGTTPKETSYNSNSETTPTETEAEKQARLKKEEEERKKKEEEAKQKAAQEAAEREEIREAWLEQYALWKEAQSNDDYLKSEGVTETAESISYTSYLSWDSSKYLDWLHYGVELSNSSNNKIDLQYEDHSTDGLNKETIIPSVITDKLEFYLPQYGVQDFINERALWQKGTYNLLGEPGWFYFKLFFKFNDFKGLFGGVLNNELPKTCALRYLAGIRNYYKYDNIYDRMLALARFVHTLSYINSQSPWFFTGLSNLNSLNEVVTTDFTKEKSFDIICNNDAIDMRLNTLLDMYRKAVYDEINQKEILPENLRKFDMSIVIMNIPIKYFQTAIILSGKNNAISHFTNDKKINNAIDKLNNITSFISGNTDITTFDYKSINGVNNSPLNRLSFQMYTLRNCEINFDSFKNYIPSSVNNTEFFKLGGGAIKINYDRCYKHTFNEWNQMMYGTDNFIYDQEANYINTSNLTSLIDRSKYTDINLVNSVNDQNKRIEGIKNSIYNSFFNKDATAYKSLIDFSESIIKDSMINSTNQQYLGNIYDIENTDRNDWASTWKRTKNKITNFFTDGW